MGLASKAFVMYEPFATLSMYPERIKLLTFGLFSSASWMLLAQEDDTVVEQQTVYWESKEFSMSNKCFTCCCGINRVESPVAVICRIAEMQNFRKKVSIQTLCYKECYWANSFNWKNNSKLESLHPLIFFFELLTLFSLVKNLFLWAPSFPVWSLEGNNFFD